MHDVGRMSLWPGRPLDAERGTIQMRDAGRNIGHICFRARDDGCCACASLRLLWSGGRQSAAETGRPEGAIDHGREHSQV